MLVRGRCGYGCVGASDGGSRQVLVMVVRGRCGCVGCVWCW